MYKFELTESEIKKFEKWKKEMKKKDDSMPTAGERWTFMFTPSVFSTIVGAKDEVTGEEIDLTDWDNL